MTWLREPGTLEYIIISLFGILYILYIIRIFLISRKLKSDFRNIFYKFFLRSGYFLVLIIALLGPSFGNVKKEIKSISKEMYLVVDISLSMNAADIMPSRLDKAKQELKRIVNSLSSDKIGIIAFSSSAFVQCPLTYDKSALNLFIETLNPEIAPNQGSDLTEGLRFAKDLLIKTRTGNYNQIIVLITDGENFNEEDEDITEELVKNSIYLSILGIGTEKGSKIPFNGTFKKDKNNQEVVTRLESSYLRELAEKAEGSYFQINELKNETEYLISQISRIEGSLSEVKEVDANANKYLYFLAFGFLLILVDVLITVRTVKIA